MHTTLRNGASPFRALLVVLPLLLLRFLNPIPASGAENLVTLNVEPDKEHPRNSEGAFAELPSGRILFSSDDGKTWPLRKLIEDDPSGWFCYTAIHFTKDAILLAYCAGDPKVGGLNRLRIRRLTFDWLPAN